MEDSRQERSYAIVRRARSFVSAFRGIWIVARTTPNAWIQLVLLAGAIVLGLYVHLDRYEWLFVACAAGLVLCAEAFNTAIEIDMNLTSPEYHPFARDTKDVAAGAVMIAAIAAAIIGAFIFIPHLLALR